MSEFERTYQIDPSREKDHERESQSIELSDREHLIRLGVKFHDPKFNEKLSIVEKITEETHVIELRKEPAKDNSKKPKGVKNAKNTSKSTARKSQKNNPKSNKAAMA